MSPEGWYLDVVRPILLLMGAMWVPTVGAFEHQQDAPKVWLARMAEAVENLNYEGTFVWQREGRLESMRIVHMVDESGEQERLLALNGHAREVLREGDKVTCILPGLRSVLVGKQPLHHAFPVVLPNDLDTLEQYYQFVWEGPDRIAGRSVYQVGILPKDSFRYGYRLWLEAETGLPLKSDLLGEDGKALEQVMFTTLRFYDTLQQDRLEASTDGKLFTWIDKQSSNSMPTQNDVQWQFRGLPQGFHLASHRWRHLPGVDSRVEHLVLSDGLASLSIYIERLMKGGGLQGKSRMGPVNAFGKTLGEYQITVVGEVPQATVELIGRSIRPLETEAQ